MGLREGIEQHFRLHVGRYMNHRIFIHSVFSAEPSDFFDIMQIPQAISKKSNNV